ncbi:uncharacterized protein PAC_06332 [Phialocephala subalpina]|uniref:NAD dependent epimerase/dehydratase n=1 Tax=Phialocephala subalpina TaxID=576137 RepID=A0A1L7WUI5_9HELO|nr:uncharacterized protein PAC_06332 [Phialocephala subalpina]
MERKPIRTIHYADTNTILSETQKAKPTDLSQRIQVIGAGFSRTATVSFTLALQKLLKGPVCHGGAASLVREEEFIKKWIEALDPRNTKESTKTQLKDLLAGYVACTDWCCYMFVPELAEAFPDAKIIVTTRDAEKWWASYVELKAVAPWWIGYVFASMPKLRWFRAWSDAMKKKGDTILPLDTKVDGPEFLEVYHNYIRSVVPPERLFFFNVKDGWEPLCKILNVPIPDEPFPHANDKLAVQTAFKALIKEAVMRWLLLLVPSIFVLGYFLMTR